MIENLLLNGRPVYLNNLLDEVFNKPFSDALDDFITDKSKDKFFPYPHNIYYNTSDNSVTFEVSATGADKEDISVSVDDWVLKVVVDKKKDENKENDRQYIVRKLSEKSIHLEYKLSEKYDVEKLNLKLDKGVLFITVPLREEAKPKRYNFKVK